MACAECGSPIAPRSRFCVRCGAAAPTAGSCARCSTVPADGDFFCALCGLDLSERLPPGRRDDARILWLISGMFLGALLSGAGAFVFWMVETSS